VSWLSKTDRSQTIGSGSPCSRPNHYVQAVKWAKNGIPAFKPTKCSWNEIVRVAMAGAGRIAPVMQEPVARK
jgi:hypothetical protein